MAKCGKKLKYKTVEELQAKIDEYFNACKGEVLTDADGNALTDKYGRPIMVNAVPPTITGLALALGFRSRQALLNYQHRAEFEDAVTVAKLRVEAYVESRLFDRDGVRGAEFNLKNNFSGWRDNPGEDNEEILKKLDRVIGGIDAEADR